MKAFRFKRFARKSYSVFNSIHKAVTIGVLSGSTLVSAHTTAAEPMERVHAVSSTDTIPLTELDEVVVTGQGAEIARRRLASNVATVDGMELEKMPHGRVDQML